MLFNSTGLFMDWKLQSESSKATLFKPHFAGAQLGGGGEGIEASPAFFKNRKKCRDFEKNTVIVHPWVESSIQNVDLRESRSKSSKFFLCGDFSLVFLTTKSLSKCPNSRKPPLPWNISGCEPASLWVFSFKFSAYLQTAFSWGGLPLQQPD